MWPVPKNELDSCAMLQRLHHLCNVQLYDILEKDLTRQSKHSPTVKEVRSLFHHSSLPSYSARILRRMGLTTELYWMLSQICCFWTLERKRVRVRGRERGGMTRGMHHTPPFLPLSFSTASLWALFWHECQHVISSSRWGTGIEASIIPEPALHSMRPLHEGWAAIVLKPTWLSWRRRQSGQHDCLQRWSTVRKETREKVEL